MDYRFHTVNDAAMAAECGRLRDQYSPVGKTVIYVMIPFALALCIACVLRHSLLPGVLFGIGTVTLIRQAVQFHKARERDEDGRHRTVTFSGNEIVLSVQETGNTYQFFREDIQAAVFSDRAGLLIFDSSCVAVSADGFETGTFADFRTEIEAETAEKTKAFRKDDRNRRYCFLAAWLLCAVITVLHLFGVF